MSEKGRVELNLTVFQLPGKMHLTHLSVACHRSHPAISPWICPSLKVLTGWQLAVGWAKAAPLEIHIFGDVLWLTCLKTSSFLIATWQIFQALRAATWNCYLLNWSSNVIKNILLWKIPFPESKLISIASCESPASNVKETHQSRTNARQTQVELAESPTWSNSFSLAPEVMYLNVHDWGFLSGRGKRTTTLKGDPNYTPTRTILRLGKHACFWDQFWARFPTPERLGGLHDKVWCLLACKTCVHSENICQHGMFSMYIYIYIALYCKCGPRQHAQVLNPIFARKKGHRFWDLESG